MTNKPTLYISCGLPGAGKSTFLKKTALPSEIIVSRDEIRYSLLKEGEPYFQHEIEVAKLFYAKIAENLSKGKNVYADATHLNNYSRSKLLGQLEPYNLDFNIEVIFFDVPIYVCIERNEKRTGRAKVPIERILNMSQNLQKPYPDYAKHLWIIDEDGDVEKEW